MDIELFLCLANNLGVLIRDPATGKVATIDAPDAAAIEAALQRRGWKLDTILVTHQHADHIQGIGPLVAAHGAMVVAPMLARAAVPQAYRYVDEGDTLEIGKLRADVWHLPGHCEDHVGYHFAEAGVFFSGDVLFAMGCGRVLGSTIEKLHHSVMRVAELPDATQVYCGHEYTLANARFCAHVAPDNAAIAARLARVEAQVGVGELTLPTTIGEEKATNVFVMAKSLAEFAALREAKNRF